MFITDYADIKETLRPILSLMIDLAGRRIISMSDDLKRRIFIIIDESGTLQKLDRIIDLPKIGRSRGTSIFMGIQDIGQIDSIYGKDLRQAIVNSCGNTVAFVVADYTTAEFLSDRFGEREISEVEESRSMGPEIYRDGVNISRRKSISKMILPSEFSGLQELTAYIKIANYDTFKTRFMPKNYPSKSPSFIMKDNFNL